MRSTRLILADSHRITRDGLRALLSPGPEFEVVAEAGDGRAAVELAEAHRPDVVITEIALPILNGIEATRRITGSWPGIRVLALSRHQERRFISAMLAAGASGYLPKTCTIEELSEALRIVAHGHHYISPAVTKTVLDEFVRHAASLDTVGDPTLTPRECEVLQLLAEGHNTKEIAALLRVSPKTVETHRRQVMVKLDLHSIAELTRYALREGITSL